MPQNRLIILKLCMALFFSNSFAQSNALILESNVVFKVVPSETDPEIKRANTPHYVVYNPSIKQGKILLFMPGTNGIALKGPKDLFMTAVQQGYRVINMSYINTPAVAQICRGKTLEANSNCTKDFRTKRIFGNNTFSLIQDESEDAIVNRLAKLLMYLSEKDKDGNWELYLENGDPKWEEIAVAGQSQGGGMAAFIAKRHLVSRVITFSGGWDFTAKNEIAEWYSESSVTPVDRWYGTYHKKEPMAKTIDATYRAMNIPESHIYAFDLDVPEGKKAHSNGVRNTGYLKMWIDLLGRGN